MQAKKEIFAFCILILLCAFLTFTAAFSMKTEPNCAKTSKPGINSCQQQPKSKNLPWNFFTHSILHFSA